LSLGDPPPDLRGRDGIADSVELEVHYAILQVERGLVVALPIGHEQRELRQLLFDGALAPVVPADDTFGGVAAAEEEEGRLGIDKAGFSGDLEEETAIRNGHRQVGLRGGGAADEFDPLFEGDLLVVLMREAAGHYEDHLIDHLKGRAGQRKVGACDGMKAAGQDTDTPRLTGSL